MALRGWFGTRLTAVVSVACLGAAGLVACSSSTGSSSGSGSLRLTSIYAGYVTSFQQAAKDFKAKYGVSVTINNLAYTGYEQVLKTQLIGGDAPDIMLVEPPALADFEQAGYLQPLDAELSGPVLGESGSWESTFQKGLIDQGIGLDGKHYLVPWNTIAQALNYNIQLYAQAGITSPPADWSSWMADNAALQNAGVAPYAVSLAGDDAQLQWYLTPALEAALRPLTTQINLRHRQGWNFNANAPSSVAGESYTADELWVAFEKGLIDPAKAPAYRSVMTAFMKIIPYLNKDAGATTAKSQSPKFTTAKSAQTTGASLLASAYVAKAKAAGVTLQLGLANLPTMTQSDVPEMTDGTMNPLSGVRAGLVINKNSKDVANAKKFLEFLTQKDEENKILPLEETATTGPEGSPAVVGVTDPNAGGVTKDTFDPQPKYAELHLYGFGNPPTFDNQDTSEFNAQFEKLIEGKMSLDDFLKARSASNQAALKRNLEVDKSSIDQSFIDKELGH